MHTDLVEVHPFSCLKDFFMLGEGGLRGWRFKHCTVLLGVPGQNG